MLEHDAGQRGRKLPVFGGDPEPAPDNPPWQPNGDPLRSSHKKAARRAKRRIAVSCMRHLLQAGVAALKELPGKASALQGMAMRLRCCVLCCAHRRLTHALAAPSRP